MARMTMSSVSARASRAWIMAMPMAGCVMALSVQPGLLVGEGHRGQRLAVDGAVGGQDPGPETVDQRLVGRPARRHDVPGHLVGVDQHGAPLDQEVGHGRLPGSDAARQADGQHQPRRDPGRGRRQGPRRDQEAGRAVHPAPGPRGHSPVRRLFVLVTTDALPSCDTPGCRWLLTLPGDLRPPS